MDHTAVVGCSAKGASGMVVVAVEVEVLTQVGTSATPQPDMLRRDTPITHQYATHATVVKANIVERRVGVPTTVVVVACSQVAEFTIACSAISMRLTRAVQDTLPATLAAKQDFLTSIVL